MYEQSYDEAQSDFLQDLYAKRRRDDAFAGDSVGEVRSWVGEARPVLQNLIGLKRIQSDVGDFTPSVERQNRETLGDYRREKWRMEVEPHFTIPFWLLRPLSAGPHPLALFPHGHYSKNGLDYAVGIAHSSEVKEEIEKDDLDVAVQAVRRGFISIAPATRGFPPVDIPDVSGRHGNRDCRSHLMHVLLAGRTVIGERVWDLQRLMDWAMDHQPVDGDNVLMMGNSGGGVATLYAAACDRRVTTAVVSCSFCPFVSSSGTLTHCDCNIVPGIMRFGGIADVAGLICRRRLLIVNGREDSLFPPDEVDRAVSDVQKIYETAGAADNFKHVYGSGGHRFYSDLMWPFVLEGKDDGQST